MGGLSKSTNSSSSSSSSRDEDVGLRRGPWTLEEDTLLIHYIAGHGEGRWNLLAKRSGLRRTGKSCRLRWLNYLKPDVKRGNLTPQEQLLILQLHFKWGNRWSKIAQHLPGRTDNEIKNYWRTRVQKQARHLKLDTNSTVFQEVIRCYWMPRLLQMIQASQNPIITTTHHDHDHDHHQNSTTDLISHGKVNQYSLLSVPVLVAAQGHHDHVLKTSQTAPAACNSSSDDHHYSTNYSANYSTTTASSSSESLNNVFEFPKNDISAGYSTITTTTCSPHHSMDNNINDYYNTFLNASCCNLDNVNVGSCDMAQSLISLHPSTSTHLDFGCPFGHEINCHNIDGDHFVDCLWNMYG